MVRRVNTQATLVPSYRIRKLKLFLTASTRYLDAMKTRKRLQTQRLSLFYFLPLSNLLLSFVFADTDLSDYTLS
jgi:hypothetical protein